MKTINVRIKTGWKKVQNEQEYVCDRCGNRLWKAPDGTTYCNGNWNECILKKTNKRWYPYKEFGCHYKIVADVLMGCPTNQDGTPDVDCDFYVDFPFIMSDKDGKKEVLRLKDIFVELEKRH